ncbi:MAG: Ig-like domain-containing protein [Gammaproteobacteria bacterium]|nr:Ig-like domain-containing protein [Gammaproteobacteria bacterium]
MKSFVPAAFIASGLLVLAGCGGKGGASDVGATNAQSGNLPSTSGSPAAPPATPAFSALFAPLGGILPYPTDLYFSGSTDGTLNLPTTPFFPVTFRAPGSAVSEPVQNALDGFSTTGPITARFDAALDPASLTPGSVIVLQVTTDPATKAVTGVVRSLVPGTDYGASLDPVSAGTTLQITPLRPLAPKASYLVLLTNGIRNTTGQEAGADRDYAMMRTAILAEFGARPPGSPPAPAACTTVTNATLNGICRLVSTQLLVAGGAGLNPANVILSFSFSTQSIGDTLEALNATTTAGAYTLTNTGLTTAQLLPGSPGLARIYTGTLRIAYYLTAPSPTNPTAPLNTYWTAAGASPVPGIDPVSRLLTRYNPMPAATTQLDIPLLVTIPTAGSPGSSGWPVVIFQHGTPRTRGDALLVADSFAAAGFAVFAIDLPLHGITPQDTMFAALRQPGRERTFDLDLVNDTTGAPGPDGTIDATGTHFINLQSLLTSRDNLRQAVADLIRLIRTIPTVDYDGSGTADFDASRIHVVGYSLGAIVSTTLLGVSSEPGASALPMGAAGLTQTLLESSEYGPRIRGALAAANAALVPGSSLFNAFFRDAQHAIDSADGINYAARAVQLPAANPRKVHVTYIVGGAPNPSGGTWPADPTVPNSRTQVLTSLMNLPVVRSSGAVSGNGVQVRLNAGIHNSYLDPRPAPLVTDEMQREIAAFAASNGALLQITHPEVIAP